MPNLPFFNSRDIDDAQWDAISELVDANCPEMSSTVALKLLEGELYKTFHPVRSGHLIVLGFLVGEFYTKKAIIENNQPDNRVN